jgi:hypothetical protein
LGDQQIFFRLKTKKGRKKDAQQRNEFGSTGQKGSIALYGQARNDVIQSQVFCLGYCWTTYVPV